MTSEHALQIITCLRLGEEETRSAVSGRGMFRDAKSQKTRTHETLPLNVLLG